MPIHEKSLIRPENLKEHEELVLDGVDVSGHWSTFIETRIVQDYNESLEEEIAALPGGEYIHRCWQCGSCTNSCTVEPDWSAANAITFSSGAINTNDYGSNSSWTFAADNSWARQDNNTDGPAIGLFGVDAMRGTYALELEVETINDDDFIGIVFGFNDGDPSNSNANYLLLDWKQADQNVSGWGFGAKGLAVSHVQGIPTAGSFWSHSCPSPGACVNELQRSAALGDHVAQHHGPVALGAEIVAPRP